MATTDLAARTDRARAENRLGWRLAAPALIIMLAVTAWPMIRAIYLSFFSYRLTDPDAREFNGLTNYTNILSDGAWWVSVLVTVLIVIVTVAFELVLGFGLAMVMHRIVFGRGIVRTSILVPYGIITVVSAFAWQYMFANTSGFVNEWLHLGDYAWFDEQIGSLVAICVSEIWKTTPFMSLLLLAGLAQISEDMLEAAKVDGATWWQRFYKVILPNMKAAIMVALLFRTLDAYRIFDNVFVMTGGANDTSTVSMLTYSQVITRVEIGLGSALSVLLFLSVLVIAWGFMKLFRVDLSQARGA